MLRLALFLSALAAPPALADNAVSFPAAPDGTVSFTMPSGNIGCTFIPAGGTGVYHTANGREELHCTRLSPEYLVVILPHFGAGHGPIAAGEMPGLTEGPALPYGRFWQMGPFTCQSARSGLSCTNASGAGLRMARAGVVTW